MKRLVQIKRGRTLLGELTQEEAVQLLESGFLKPTDRYRAPEMQRAEPLSTLTSQPLGKSNSLLSKAQTAIAWGGNLAAQAGGLGRKVGSWASGPAKQLLDDFTPHIRKLVSKEMVSDSMIKARSALNDDDFMRKLFGAVYDCLPRPIYRFVSESSFIEFCMERRTTLLPPGQLHPPKGGAEKPV